MAGAAAHSDRSDEELLWRYLLLQYSISVGQFAVALAGLGALFFAYAEASSQFLKILVSIVGIGGSLILWNHSWGGRLEAYRAKTKIGEEEGRKELVEKFNKLQEWRNESQLGRLSPSVLRMYIYFCALLSLAWFSLFLYACGIQPSPALYVIDGTGLAIAVLLYLATPTYSSSSKGRHLFPGNPPSDQPPASPPTA